MKKYKKNIKFNYYWLVELKKDTDEQWHRDRVFNLPMWINELEQRGHFRNNVQLSDCIAYAETCEVIEDNIYVLRFYKIRETNVPAKIKLGREAMSLGLADDEYIGEDLNLLYDRSNGLVMVQSNRMSLALGRLEEWMSESVTDDRYVKFMPIKDVDALSVFQRKQIRTLEFSLGNLELLDEKGSLSEIVNRVLPYNGYTLKMSISVGRNKNRQLDGENIMGLVQDLWRNAGSVTSARIRTRDNIDAPIEIIDLLDEIMHDYIEVHIKQNETLDFAQIKVKMLKVYKNRKIDVASHINANMVEV